MVDPKILAILAKSPDGITFADEAEILASEAANRLASLDSAEDRDSVRFAIKSQIGKVASTKVASIASRLSRWIAETNADRLMRNADPLTQDEIDSHESEMREKAIGARDRRVNKDNLARASATDIFLRRLG